MAYQAIYTEHCHELRVWSTITENDFFMTSWRFTDSDQPIIKVEDYKMDGLVVNRRAFICIGMEGEDDD